MNTSAYSGDINTSDVIFNPPPELQGKINVVPEMSDVMALAIMHEGGEPCTEDLDVLRRVRDLLVERQAPLAVDGLRFRGQAVGQRHHGRA